MDGSQSAGFSRSRAWLIGLALVAGLSASHAWAGDPADSAGPAKEAYDRGTAAYRRGDYTLAAVEYARADELMPNDVALQAAVEAAVLSDELLLGMELIERSKRGPAEGTLAAALKSARDKFAGRAGRIRVVCGTAPCQAKVDGAPMDVRTMRWFKAGAHKVILIVADQPEEQLIDVHADTVVEVTPRSPTLAPRPAASVPPPQSTASQPTPPASAREPSGGISPAWFWIGTGLTVVVGGFTIASGLDTSSKHDDFAGQGCGQATTGDCSQLAKDGSSAQNRTNILIGATAVAGVTTAVVGLLLVRWSPTPASSAQVGLGPGQATLHMSF
jgi:hypothetical protein